MNITPNSSQRNETTNKADLLSMTALEEQLKNLFFGLSDVVLMINFEKRVIVEVNERAEKLLGYGPGEINGVSTDILYLDRHVYEQVGQIVASLRLKKCSQHVSLTVKRKNDSLLEVDVVILPFFNEAAGEYPGIVIAQLSDVDVENNLSVRYQMMAQNARDVVLFVQISDGRIIDANRAAVNAYGYSYNELLELNINQLGLNGNAGVKIGRKNYSSGVIHEAVHCRKDGSTFPVEISLQDTHAEDDHLLVCTIRDATLRFEAENARQVSEGRYRILFNSIMDGFALHEMVYDANGKPVDYRFIEVNPAYYTMHDLNVEVTGMLAKEIFSDKEVGPLELYDRVARTSIPAYYEYHHQKLDKYLDVMIFSPVRGQFATIMTDITARKKAEAEIRRQLQRLEALRLVDSAIATSFNLQIVIKILIDQILSKLGADAVDLLMLNIYNQTLEYETARGFRNHKLEHTNVSYDDGLIVRIMETHAQVVESHLVVSAEYLSKQRCAAFSREDFVSYVGVPILIKGRVRAVLETFFRTPFDPDEEWLSYLNTLASQAAIAIDNAELFEGLQRSTVELTRSYEATIESWARSVNLRTKEDDFHTYHVMQMTVRLARRMGMGDEDIVHIRRGAILHDIGKLAIPDQILLKPDRLSPEEWEMMRQAPEVAYGLISHIPQLLPAMDIPYSHHENWDGSGYPLGLKKNSIPLAARIFAVVEVWNVMRCDRPYGKAWSDEAVLEYIRNQSGVKFDPTVVEEFLKMLNESGD